MLVELWRNVNVLLGFVAFLLSFSVVIRRWGKISEDKKLFLIAATAFSFTGCYGSLEILYWPEYYLRVPMTSVSVCWVIAASILNYRRNRSTT